MTTEMPAPAAMSQARKEAHKPVIKELVSWFPELNFFHEFIDEGGWFFGDRTYSSGTIIDNYIDGPARESHRDFERRLSIELTGHDPESCDEE